MSAFLQIKKHVGAIHIKAGHSLLQWKSGNVLLLNAYHELPDLSVTEHSIAISALASHVGYDSKDFESLKEALRSLVSQEVEWNILDPQGRKEWGVSALLASVRITEGSGVCRYAYSPPMREHLYSPAIFARINLEVQKQFTSQFALRLYENCLRYIGTGTTGWKAVDVWRELLGVAEGHYPQYKEFRRTVLAPAVDQVNRSSDIRVAMETQRESRRISAIRFSVRPAPQELFEELADEQAVSVGGDLLARLRTLGLVTSQLEEVARRPPDVVRRNVEWVEEYVRGGGKVKRSVAALVLDAVRKDYAASASVSRRAQAALSTPADSAPSMAAAESAAREAAATALDRALDERFAALDRNQQAHLDGEAILVLREKGNPYADEIERAVEAGTVESLSPSRRGAIWATRRDVLAERAG